jgi:hypothetical protein
MRYRNAEVADFLRESSYRRTIYGVTYFCGLCENGPLFAIHDPDGDMEEYWVYPSIEDLFMDVALLLRIRAARMESRNDTPWLWGHIKKTKAIWIAKAKR